MVKYALFLLIIRFSILANNKEDYDAFFLLNSKIMPNPNIVRAFSEFLDIDSVM